MSASIYNLLIEQGSDIEKNFYFTEGAEREITQFEDNGDSSKVKATCEVHGLTNGDIVVIFGKYYAGAHTVSEVTADTFAFISTWEIDYVGATWAHPRDIAGETYEAMYRNNYSDATPLATLTCTIIAATSGHLRMTLTNVLSAALEENTGVWDMERTNVATKKRRVLQGQVSVTPEVTK